MKQHDRSIAAAIAIIGLTVAASAKGDDTCIQGFVWREAYPGDHVCVTSQTRAQAATDNAAAASRRQPGGGAAGADTCIQGYVWREATPDDRVCVTSDLRDQARADNQQASARRVSVPVSPPIVEHDPPASPGSASFWTTLPGILTALTGLIAAIATLVTALRKQK